MPLEIDNLNGQGSVNGNTARSAVMGSNPILGPTNMLHNYLTINPEQHWAVAHNEKRFLVQLGDGGEQVRVSMTLEEAYKFKKIVEDQFNQFRWRHIENENRIAEARKEVCSIKSQVPEETALLSRTVKKGD